MKRENVIREFCSKCGLTITETSYKSNKKGNGLSYTTRTRSSYSFEGENLVCIDCLDTRGHND